ncbi:hypothetical protein E2C01_069911 [Portunus trituberculatus]|uniref:Uncharacterized protein n=1 Tax=Portunus trituberculatus TaxID=210409 RepID=A0A5B7HRA3_PORTR|nr:hypothetical protein [Portunus trituberculatus]
MVGQEGVSPALLHFHPYPPCLATLNLPPPSAT